MKCKSTLIFFLLFLTALLCLAGDCDEQSADGGDDDEFPADDDNDDNNNDDNDETPEPLDLPEYQNDGRLYGVACGVDNLILTETGWEPVEIPFNFFSYCQTVDSQASVFAFDDSTGPGKVFLFTENGWHDLKFPISFIDAPMSPLIFFNRETGFAGGHLYQSGVWKKIDDLFFFDPIAPNDAVLVEQNCIYHWNGLLKRKLFCTLDIPFDPAPDYPGDMEIINLKYFSLDDLWVACDETGSEAPLYFAHWNGVEFDLVYHAIPEIGYYGDLTLSWDFSIDHRGWAVVEIVDYNQGWRNGYFFKFSVGKWESIVLPSPPVNETSKSDMAVSDICGLVCAVSDNEVWFRCNHYIENPDTLSGYSDYYYHQLLAGDSYFWSTGTNEGIRNFDVRINQ